MWKWYIITDTSGMLRAEFFKTMADAEAYLEENYYKCTGDILPITADKESDANASLIAAAPSLLNALVSLVGVIGLTAIKYDSHVPELQSAVNGALAAIKLTEG